MGTQDMRESARAITIANRTRVWRLLCWAGRARGGKSEKETVRETYPHVATSSQPEFRLEV
jgi:hypothetical protein